MCREGMLAGTFAMIQFSHSESTFVSAEEIPSPGYQRERGAQATQFDTVNFLELVPSG